jgi:transcriptional regulator with XRE-family HTH domain
MRAARIYVPNVQLREHRLRLNLTLEEVADALIALAWERFAVHIGVNAGMVGKWERGEKRPSRFYQRLFVLLYGVPADQLGFRPAGPSDQAAEDVLAQLGTGKGVPRPLLSNSAALGRARLPAPAIAMPRRVDPEAVGRLGTILTEYAKIDNLLGPAHLLALTELHLTFISELLTVAAGQGRTELLTVGARYAEFAGWLHQDAGDPQEAAYWSDRAMGWAQAAGNDLMVFYVLMRKSNQASSQGDANRTLGLARAALRGQDRLSPRARALALRQEARGHALSGDPTECARALEVARDQAAAPEDRARRTASSPATARRPSSRWRRPTAPCCLASQTRLSSPSSTAWRPCRRSISAIERSTWPAWRSPMRPAKSQSWPAPSPRRPP